MVVDAEVAVVCRGTEAERSAAILWQISAHLPLELARNRVHHTLPRYHIYYTV
jgi:hypothetical protein